MSEKTKYVVRIGVLGWGVPMFLLMGGWWRLLVHPASHSQQATPHFMYRMLIDLVVWLSAGAVFGLWMWRARVQKSLG